MIVYCKAVTVFVVQLFPRTKTHRTAYRRTYGLAIHAMRVRLATIARGEKLAAPKRETLPLGPDRPRHRRVGGLHLTDMARQQSK